MINLERFNKQQQEAIVTTDGPLLILAGAGSGKTTVVVNKIAHLLEEKLAAPWQILAITFTNKAANEMKERIEALIGDNASQMWSGTFHSLCMRILRRDIAMLPGKLLDIRFCRSLHTGPIVHSQRSRCFRDTCNLCKLF